MESNDFMRNVPRQARSSARVEAILDACGRILEAGTIDGLSVTSVANEAKIPAASVYDYFADSRSLLAAFTSRCIEQNADAIAGALTPANSAEDAVANVRTALRRYCDLICNDTAFRTAVSASHADDQLAPISFENSKKNAALVHHVLSPYVAPDRQQELRDRVLIGVHLSGAFARTLRMTEPQDADRLIETYINALVANVVEI